MLNRGDHMNRQRGIAEGWLMGALAIVALLAVSNAVTWHVATRYNESGWQAREAKTNEDAANAILAASTRVRDNEHATAAQLAAVDTYYQGKLNDQDKKHADALRIARAGGMFVNAKCPAPSGNPAGTATAAAGIGNGSTRARLSDEDAEFFISEASRADAIVEQLTACQSVVLRDRKR